MTWNHQPRTSGPVLVLGSSGKTGRRVASRLMQRGSTVRLGSRSATPSFDWTRPDDWPAVLKDVHAAYVAYPQDLPIDGATERVAAFVEEVRRAGVRRLVLLTGRGEEDGLRQEALVQRSGLEWTVIRSAWFDQNFTEGGFVDLVRERQFVLPAGDVPEPFVDLHDLADVAVAALTEPGHAGQTYEVTGPRSMTFRDAASALSAAIGERIEFVDVSHADFLAGLAATGAPDDVIGLMDFLFGTLLDGRNARLGDGVQRALGREPRNFAEFARRAAATGAFAKEVA